MPEQKISNKSILTPPFVLSLIGALAMIVSLLLPYASVTKESGMRELENVDLGGITSSEVLDPSMVKFATSYSKLAKAGFGSEAIATVTIVLTCLIAACAVLALLFALLRKGVPTLVFGVLAFLLFLAQNWDFSDRGVVPSDTYDWGLGYYVFFLAAVLLAAGSIWMIYAKHALKKAEH